jgi:putative heme iron utilization protein
MVTVVYKMYKKDNTVHYSVATRWADIVEDVDTGLSLYPIAHFVWEEKEGSARGEGEVRFLIPNQIEVNRTEVRRVLAVKLQAYPTKIYDKSKIANPEAINRVGVAIATNGQPVDDVNKIIGVVQPAQMSPDVKQLQEDLIMVTRELAGAGDTATGQVNPESASGKAILAVQQASQAPMTEQKESYKNFVEDIAKIDLDYLIVYSEDGVMMQEEVTDPMTGEEYVQMVNVPQSVLRQLQATIKIEVTPKSVYDRFAMEQTMENFLMNGMFMPQNTAQFEAYVKALPDDSVAPKQKLQDVLDNIKETQQRIAQINAQAQIMQQRAQQFLMEDPDGQAQQIADAQMQLNALQQMPEEEQSMDNTEEI